jgi:hypothetical protein
VLREVLRDVSLLRDGEVGRWGDGEMGRLGDWEMVIGRLGEWEIGRLGDWEIGRLGEWGTGGLGDLYADETDLLKQSADVGGFFLKHIVTLVWLCVY